MNHVLVPADDIGKTKEFYSDVLGLDIVEMPATGYSFNMQWYRSADGVEVHCVQKDEAVAGWTGTDFNPTMQPHVAFEVEDYEATKAELRARGIPFYEAHGEGVLVRRQLFVRDPAGLTLELYQPGDQVAVQE
jgi:catechol 2,3-dioxygenase-like lactoylglutathione lyase family enzyme